jgi:hypothetical protein
MGRVAAAELATSTQQVVVCCWLGIALAVVNQCSAFRLIWAEIHTVHASVGLFYLQECIECALKAVTGVGCGVRMDCWCRCFTCLGGWMQHHTAPQALGDVPLSVLDMCLM